MPNPSFGESSCTTAASGLVEVRGADGWTWRSSLSREDSGNGGCEVVYVCALASY